MQPAASAGQQQGLLSAPTLLAPDPDAATDDSGLQLSPPHPGNSAGACGSLFTGWCLRLRCTDSTGTQEYPGP
eukprot:5398943-Pyramimonas_sp.AAC.1